MVDRQRHPDKDLEKLLQEAEVHGWQFGRSKGYFKGKCPCGLHMKTVALTPSGSRYRVNLLHTFTRLDCWN